MARAMIAEDARPPTLGVRLSVVAEGSSSELATLLLWLEESPPLLAIREIAVSQGEVSHAHEQIEQLRVSLVIDGIAWRGARPEVPASRTTMTACCGGSPQTSALP